MLSVIYIYFSMMQQPLVGQGFLIIEASRSHSDTPLSLGFLWRSDQPDVETFTWQETTLTSETSVPPAEFEPAIPTSERLQTHAVGLVAIGILWYNITQYYTQFYYYLTIVSHLQAKPMRIKSVNVLEMYRCIKFMCQFGMRSHLYKSTITQHSAVHHDFNTNQTALGYSLWMKMAKIVTDVCQQWKIQYCFELKTYLFDLYFKRY
jgi:hypothetical protein